MEEVQMETEIEVVVITEVAMKEAGDSVVTEEDNLVVHQVLPLDRKVVEVAVVF